MVYNENMSSVKKACVYIRGMHCPSCDVLVKDTFERLPHIRSVNPNYRTQTAEIVYTGHLNTHVLNEKLARFGYEVSQKPEARASESVWKRLSDAGVIAVLLFIGYYLAQEFGLLPDFAATTKLTLSSAFLLGLVASTSSCMATSGALFMTTVNKRKVGSGKMQYLLLPAVMFNTGRVFSYGAFGFLAGLVGKGIVDALHLGQWLTVFVAVMMLLIGLDMLKLLPFSAIFTETIGKRLFSVIEKPLAKYPQRTAFFLGAITYLLPCGFTQSVQLYALGLASPWQSAALMMMFALGTVPALLALAFVNGFGRSVSPWFTKVVGVFVLIVAFGYLNNFATLEGFSLALAQTQPAVQNILIKGGVQVATMDVSSSGYSPNVFTVKAGVPVKWVINGLNVFGCQGTVVAPKISVNKTIALGQNVIEFTPKEPGIIPFSCTMGMYKGQFNVISS